MQNVYNDILFDMSYNKFVVGKLLFVEYTCPITEDLWSVWSESDFIIHVLKGRKVLTSGLEEWPIKAGDSLYIRKGSFTLEQFFDEEFCMFGFFINDDFIRSTIHEIQAKGPMNPRIPVTPFSMKRINHNAIFDGFIQSMFPFFSFAQKPSNSLLELKLKELVINLLTNRENTEISSYFISLMETDKPSIRNIMESNFHQSLSLSEFAKLSHRSLSTFKRDFKEIYATSPGRWLLEKRLNFAMNLIKNTDLSISSLSYKSGFENMSHFSKAFKDHFGNSPSAFRSK